MKNITRYTYDKTAYQGYRVCLSKHGEKFQRYFSDKKYGGQLGAEKAALAYKAALIKKLETVKLRAGKLTKKTLKEIQAL